MGLKADLEKNVDEIIGTRWEKRDGREVPESKNVTFIHQAVLLDATFLYADLNDSTSLAGREKWLAAEVFQCYLSSVSRVILSESGAIRSFDGDRVMAVFVGDDKNSRAARCALKINWVFKNVVRERLMAAYGSKLQGYDLAYTAGLDTGAIWAVRGGVRDNSDLVWVGSAPNLAAKLSNLAVAGYPTWITGSVYDRLEPKSKASSDGRSMWEERVWTNQGNIRIYRSNFWWPII
jgi:class 3 adenylate cyclase